MAFVLSNLWLQSSLVKKMDEHVAVIQEVTRQLTALTAVVSQHSDLTTAVGRVDSVVRWIMCRRADEIHLSR